MYPSSTGQNKLSQINPVIPRVECCAEPQLLMTWRSRMTTTTTTITRVRRWITCMLLMWAELILFVFNKHWDIMLCRIFVYLKLYIMYIIYEINKGKDLNIKTPQERWRIVEAEEEEYHQKNHSFDSIQQWEWHIRMDGRLAGDDCWRHDRMNLLYLFSLIFHEGEKGDESPTMTTDGEDIIDHVHVHPLLVPTPAEYLFLASSPNSNPPAYVMATIINITNTRQPQHISNFSSISNSIQLAVVIRKSV